VEVNAADPIVLRRHRMTPLQTTAIGMLLLTAGTFAAERVSQTVTTRTSTTRPVHVDPEARLELVFRAPDVTTEDIQDQSGGIRVSPEGVLSYHREGKDGSLVLSPEGMARLKVAAAQYLASPPPFVQMIETASWYITPTTYKVRLGRTLRLTVINTGQWEEPLWRLSQVLVACVRQAKGDEATRREVLELIPWFACKPLGGGPWPTRESHDKDVFYIPNGAPADIARRIMLEIPAEHARHDGRWTALEHLHLLEDHTLGQKLLRLYKKAPSLEPLFAYIVLVACARTGCPDALPELDSLLRDPELIRSHYTCWRPMYDVLEKESYASLRRRFGGSGVPDRIAEKRMWQWLLANRHRLNLSPESHRYVLSTAGTETRPAGSARQVRTVPDPAKGDDAERQTRLAQANLATLAKLQENRPSVRVQEIRLDGFIDIFRDLTDLNIEVDWVALMVAGVEKTTPITLNLNNVSNETVLREALGAAGGGVKLDFVVEGGVIRISTMKSPHRQPAPKAGEK